MRRSIGCRLRPGAVGQDRTGRDGGLPAPGGLLEVGPCNACICRARRSWYSKRRARSTREVGSPTLSWWEPDRWTRAVWEPAGEVRGAAQVHLGRGGHWLRVTGVGATGATRATKPDREGLRLIADRAGGGRSVPVYVTVRDYEMGMGGILTGFRLCAVCLSGVFRQACCRDGAQDGAGGVSRCRGGAGVVEVVVEGHAPEEPGAWLVLRKGEFCHCERVDLYVCYGVIASEESLGWHEARPFARS